jgi:hypothetical protein
VDIGVDPVSAAIGVVGVVLAIVSIRLTIRLAKQPTPEPLPEPTPLFEGRVDSPAKVREFVDFLDAHQLRRVRLDVALPADVTTPEGNLLAARRLFLAAPPGDGYEGYEISLKVEDVASSPLTYAHGIWRLNSYVAVERPAGIWQGILARQLIPISLDEVARD